jgi:hypothetical protein
MYFLRTTTAVTIMQKVPILDQKTGVHRHIARHLFHPLLVGMTGDTPHMTALVMFEKYRFSLASLVMAAITNIL